MRGKYKRRQRARIERENGGGVNCVPASQELKDHWAFIDAIAEAQKLKRAKKRGCSNLDRNMESLGYRRIAGDEMVPEQFEAVR